MPAVNVARTDTFEIQRQKINDIATQIFNISAGGSDLSTGILKLGDGTKTGPSLAFTTDDTLGLYKPQAKAIGFVSGSKRIADLRESQVVSFKDLFVQKKSISTETISITNPGQNYDPGLYAGISLIGGTGLNATADITVDGFLGTVLTQGDDFTQGLFNSLLVGGSGQDAAIQFNVDGIQGTITDAGSGYAPNTYTGLNLTNISGSGSNATADIVVAGNVVVAGTITNGGSGYAGADGIFTAVSLTNGSGSGLTADVTLTGGVVTNIVVDNGGFGYVASDVLGIDPADVAGDGGSPTGSGFAFTISSVIYDGEVTNITITSDGAGYSIGDVLSVSQADLGNVGGSGFEYTIISDPGVPYNVEFTSKGEGYTIGDVLSLGGGVTGVSANLSGTIPNVSATTTTGSTTIVVTSTTDIIPGMSVSGDAGQFPETATVVTVDSATEITVSDPATASGAATITFSAPGDSLIFTVSDVSGISNGFLVVQTGGTGNLNANTVVTNVDIATNEITINVPPLRAGAVTLDFTPPYGSPSTNFTFRVDVLGAVSDINVVNDGAGYDIGDTLTVSATDLTEAIVIPVTVIDVDNVIPSTSIPAGTYSVGDIVSIDSGEGAAIDATVVEIVSSGANIDVLVITGASAPDGSTIDGVYTVGPNGFAGHRYLINGNVGESLTLYVGNTYTFDTLDATNTGHVFALSSFRDGIFAPSLITNVATSLSTSTTTISVADTTGILPGMEVVVISGSGDLLAGTKVESVPNGTDIVLDRAPLLTGAAVLSFTGTQYTDNVVRDGTNSLSIKITDTTPNLYYYCENHPDMGGYDNQEGLLTVDSNNPKVFGSGLVLTALDIVETNVISNQVATGTLSSIISTGTSLDFDNGTVDDIISITTRTETLTATTIQSDITGDDKIDINSGTTVNIVAGDFNIGSSIQVVNSTGNFTTTGTLKSTTKISSNDILEIIDNTISVVPGQDLVFEVPTSSNQTKITSTSALVIPSGDTSQRPTEADSKNGAIRFNTQTGSYEGYSEATSTWASLGGVRDLDNNTTILAEETVGANDNTLWFINDNVNTLRVTPSYLDFVNVKKIKSTNVSAPDYSEWRANAPATLGEYLKYRNNIYEVTAAGTTATSGSEPTHTSGAEPNGTAELTYFTSAVSALTFEEVSEVRIDPLGFTDLVVNNELRFSTNTISSDFSDIVIDPNDGQKVVIQAASSLVIPVGNNDQKGNPLRGSIRYNTDDTTFEGFDGTTWGSLGGVKDIDGDTQIKPETSPNADEDILYFFNQGSNTLRVTTAQVEFDTIDTITSTTSNTFNVNASTLTFDNLATTLDNTSTTETFLFSTKENFDLGLSSGLTTDPLLRLTDTGDIYYNLGFGTGVYNAIKIFDSELKELEIADYKVVTKKLDLERGVLNSGDAVLYDPATQESAKVFVTAHNTTTGDKHYLEYSVIDKGTDIFYTEIGSILTGEDLVITTFDFTAGNEVRATLTLNTALTAGDDVEITVVSHITKR
jgi:hypothetical protein